jgi:predicted aconitase with swiveling domain
VVSSRDLPQNPGLLFAGAVFAGITITEGWPENATEVFQTGDTVRVDPHRKAVELLRRA